ncbi:MAG: hypothetical protein D6677_11115 [Calditrichaeota bacterium]|nr:MAG: hypothetical protein D6677_11115 [Calditrichota bacterium]
MGLLLVLGLSLTSCGWKASEEEIQTLEETRAAALDAEKAYQDKKAEADDLQRQVDAKKAELKKAQAEKEKVSKAVEARKAADGE